MKATSASSLPEIRRDPGAVIYWKDLATIQAFARDPNIVVATKRSGIWYSKLDPHCKVERRTMDGRRIGIDVVFCAGRRRRR